MAVQRYAVIDTLTNIVINTILWNPNDAWEFPEDCYVMQSDDAGMGYSYIDGVFIAPKPPDIPEEQGGDALEGQGE